MTTRTTNWREFEYRRHGTAVLFAGLSMHGRTDLAARHFVRLDVARLDRPASVPNAGSVDRHTNAISPGGRCSVLASPDQAELDAHRSERRLRHVRRAQAPRYALLQCHVGGIIVAWVEFGSAPPSMKHC
jgi:hypothetical protein